MSIHCEVQSCSDLSRVLVLNEPPALVWRSTGANPRLGKNPAGGSPWLPWLPWLPPPGPRTLSMRNTFIPPMGGGLLATTGRHCRIHLRAAFPI